MLFKAFSAVAETFVIPSEGESVSILVKVMRQIGPFASGDFVLIRLSRLSTNNGVATVVNSHCIGVVGDAQYDGGEKCHRYRYDYSIVYSGIAEGIEIDENSIAIGVGSLNEACDALQSLTEMDTYGFGGHRTDE